jgi:arylsulfatase A-like enzyme
MADDTRMRWMRPHEVPTLGNWFRAAGYDTHYDGKWHISHADLHDPATGQPLATNDSEGRVIDDHVAAYLDADPLGPFGFSGWVGPEPHGGLFGNAGLVRDRLIADRVVAWLDDRYARRRAGDDDAQRPFLLVASFVNPHDIVLFPLWMRRGMPPDLADIEVPAVPPPPTATEDLRTKPAAQIAYRSAYPSCYGPPGPIVRMYRDHDARYRELYYRLHAAVDGPVDRVRRAVTDQTTGDAVLVRTADHGELLGAHGGLHQKWFQLYDESTRVPFAIACVGSDQTTSRRVAAPTSHVDLVPTLLAAASIDEAAIGRDLAAAFSEVHPLPGRDLMSVVAGEPPDDERVVYVMTRDNMPEGDTGASGLARAFGRAADAPGPLRIRVAAHVATNFEGVVGRVDESEVAGGGGHLWKLVRCFDDPAAWTEPGVRQLASDGIGGPRYRTMVLPDQWELYDLDADPIETENRWDDPAAAAVFAHLLEQLKVEQHRAVPERNQPWPYVTSRMTEIDEVPLLPPRALVEMQLRQRVAKARARVSRRRR